MILLKKKFTDKYFIKNGISIIPLSNAIIAEQNLINENKELRKIDNQRSDCNNNIALIKTDIERILKEIKNIQESQKNTEDDTSKSDIDENDDNKDEIKIDELKQELSLKEKELVSLNIELENYNTKLDNFEPLNIFLKLESELQIANEKIKNLSDLISQSQNNIKNIDPQTAPPEQQTVLTENKKNLTKYESQLKIANQTRDSLINDIELVNEDLDIKYTTDINELNSYINDYLNASLVNSLPSVVFWENNENYTLQSETLFSEILEKENIDLISRPLVNVFRIGLGIKNFDDLKSSINEIQTDKNERSRIGDKLTQKVNKYIKGIWEEYDQKIRINLEQERILISVL
jgi:predicted  nucleic acid-binding Zn-ribbon protein